MQDLRKRRATSSFRRKNEIDAEQFFAESYAGLMKEYKYSWGLSFRLIGIWQQIWEGYPRQTLEVQAKYEALAERAWSEVREGRVFGVMLHSVYGFCDRFDLEEYPKEIQIRLIATHLWACTESLVQWDRFGGKRKLAPAWGESSRWGQPTLPKRQGEPGVYTRAETREKNRQVIREARERNRRGE